MTPKTPPPNPYPSPAHDPYGTAIGGLLGRLDAWRERRSKPKPKLRDRVQLLAYKLVFAHLGKFMIVAAYYLALQTMHGQHTTIFSWHVTLPRVKQTWDHLLSADTAHGGLLILMPQATWNSMRHIVFRGLLEGILGIVLFQQIGFNVLKYDAKLKAHREKHPDLTLLDRVILKSKVLASPYQNKPVTGLQYAFFPVWLVTLAATLGTGLYLLLHYVIGFAPHPAAHGVLQRIYVGEYDGLVIGLFVGVLAARTYRAYLYDNAMFIAQTWTARGQRPRWWMPWPTRNLIAGLRAKPDAVGSAETALGKRSRWDTFLALTLPLVALAAAAYGFYVITYVAK